MHPFYQYICRFMGYVFFFPLTLGCISHITNICCLVAAPQWESSLRLHFLRVIYCKNVYLLEFLAPSPAAPSTLPSSPALLNALPHPGGFPGNPRKIFVTSGMINFLFPRISGPKSRYEDAQKTTFRPFNFRRFGFVFSRPDNGFGFRLIFSYRLPLPASPTF